MPGENPQPTAELHNVKNENGEFTYVKLPERPADVPEKFWSADHGVNLTALNKGYLNLESSRARFEEETRTRLKTEAQSSLPRPPEQYRVEPPKLDNAPSSFDYKPEEDPIIKQIMASGRDMGLTQEGFSHFVQQRGQQELEQFQTLGRSTRDVLGENAKDRIDKLSRRLTEQLGEQEFNAISAAVSDPHAVVALEKLIGTTTGAPRAGDGAGSGEKLTEADVKAWMTDPRYWDPQRRDPRWMKKIEDGWKTLFKDEKHDGEPRFTHG